MSKSTLQIFLDMMINCKPFKTRFSLLIVPDFHFGENLGFCYQERESWTTKERHYLAKLDEMSDAHLEAMEQQKVCVCFLLVFTKPL